MSKSNCRESTCTATVAHMFRPPFLYFNKFGAVGSRSCSPPDTPPPFTSLHPLLPLAEWVNKIHSSQTANATQEEMFAVFAFPSRARGCPSARPRPSAFSRTMLSNLNLHLLLVSLTPVVKIEQAKTPSSKPPKSLQSLICSNLLTLWIDDR